MSFDVMDFIVPLVVALVFLGLGRVWLFAVRRGQPLTSFMKGALFYGFFFILGMGYLMMFGGNLHWHTTVLFSVIALWGGIVALFAWWRFQKRKHSPRE